MLYERQGGKPNMIICAIKAPKSVGAVLKLFVKNGNNGKTAEE